MRLAERIRIFDGSSTTVLAFATGPGDAITTGEAPGIAGDAAPEAESGFASYFHFRIERRLHSVTSKWESKGRTSQNFGAFSRYVFRGDHAALAKPPNSSIKAFAGFQRDGSESVIDVPIAFESACLSSSS